MTHYELPASAVMDGTPTEEPSSPGVPEHLGGHHHVTNMDLPTLRYLVGQFGVRSMLDVGCGPGGMVDYGRSLGLDAWGIDGDETLARFGIIAHDYSRGPWLMAAPVDLVWSVEFVEHVEERYLPNVLDTFRRARVLFMTHAVPGQPGHHHVNCQPPRWWVRTLQLDGWRLDLEATGYIRVFSEMWYARQTGLVFVRSDQ